MLNHLSMIFCGRLTFILALMVLLNLSSFVFGNKFPEQHCYNYDGGKLNKYILFIYRMLRKKEVKMACSMCNKNNINQVLFAVMTVPFIPECCESRCKPPLIYSGSLSLKKITDGGKESMELISCHDGSSIVEVVGRICISCYRESMRDKKSNKINFVGVNNKDIEIETDEVFERAIDVLLVHPKYKNLNAIKIVKAGESSDIPLGSVVRSNVEEKKYNSQYSWYQCNICFPVQVKYYNLFELIKHAEIEHPKELQKSFLLPKIISVD